MEAFPYYYVQSVDDVRDNNDLRRAGSVGESDFSIVGISFVVVIE